MDEEQEGRMTHLLIDNHTFFWKESTRNGLGPHYELNFHGVEFVHVFQSVLDENPSNDRWDAKFYKLKKDGSTDLIATRNKTIVRTATPRETCGVALYILRNGSHSRMFLSPDEEREIWLNLGGR